jgi:FkbM family methyltransferase
MSVILIKAAPETACICTEKIYITKLDNIVGKFLKINNNIFLKIDVQGYELQVLN